MSNLVPLQDKKWLRARYVTEGLNAFQWSWTGTISVIRWPYWKKDPETFIRNKLQQAGFDL